jgi:large subunit ribosomal protein L9
MQIVLLERIAKLGQMGDVVTVKDGYARNFLLPQGKALRANKANLERFESERQQLETRNLERKTDAEKVHEKLNGNAFVIIRQSGDSGQLYGSVTSRDVAETLTEAGFEATRSQIAIDQPIKTLGLHDVAIVLHPDVDTSVVINVARTEEEAERQAAGEDVTVEKLDDDEEVMETSDVFEEGVEVDLSDDAADDAEAEASEAAADTAADEGDDAAPAEEAEGEKDDD